MAHEGQDVPRLKGYYPSVERMDRAQKRFYRKTRGELQAGRHVEVDGNISYLFVYAYELLGDQNRAGFEGTYDRLLELAEHHNEEPKFAEYCRSWAYDCLLGKKAYNRFLELTELDDPALLFRTATHSCNRRCNISHLLAEPAAAADLVRMCGIRVTKYTKKHPLEFSECLDATFAESGADCGSWLQRCLGMEKMRTYPVTLFQGAPIDQPVAPFESYPFYSMRPFLKEIRVTAKRAENALRERHGMPGIGEGWVAETELYRALSSAFPETQVVHHGRPSWLGRQHLDVWLPRWSIAVEYQGEQHFRPVEFFGGEQAYKATVERDLRKAALCEKQGVVLLLATEESSHTELIEKITSVRVGLTRTALPSDSG